RVPDSLLEGFNCLVREREIVQFMIRNYYKPCIKSFEGFKDNKKLQNCKNYKLIAQYNELFENNVNHSEHTLHIKLNQNELFIKTLKNELRSCLWLMNVKNIDALKNNKDKRVILGKLYQWLT
ncbi:unnamed protein product, partial [marine sediment metagenome]